MASLPCFMSQRGDSGQKNTPMARMSEGMKAEPNCRRQAILPVSLTMMFAARPRKMPGEGLANVEGQKGPRWAWERLTCYDPELPEHHEGAADPGGGDLGRKDGDRGVLGANADAHDEARGKEALPILGETRGDRRGSQTEGGDEDLAATAEIVVHGIDDEGATTRYLNVRHGPVEMWGTAKRAPLTSDQQSRR